LSVKLLIYIASKPIAQKIGNMIKILKILIKTKSTGLKNFFFSAYFWALQKSNFFVGACELLAFYDFII